MRAAKEARAQMALNITNACYIPIRFIPPVKREEEAGDLAHQPVRRLSCAPCIVVFFGVYIPMLYITAHTAMYGGHFY